VIDNLWKVFNFEFSLILDSIADKFVFVASNGILTVYVYLINLERLLIKPGLDRIQINQIFYYILLLICIFLFVSISFCSCFGLSWISVFKYFKILFSITLKCSFAGILSTLFQRIQCLSIRWYIFSDNDTSTTWKPLYCPRCYKIPFRIIHHAFQIPCLSIKSANKTADSIRTFRDCFVHDPKRGLSHIFESYFKS
jgi:hypothetical protein